MIALDNGFQEVVAIVHDLDESVARLCGLLGYRPIWRGPSESAVLDLMGLEPGWDAQEALIGDPEQGRGHIRLIAFPGRETGVMRDGAQPWDTGGIFDINIRPLRTIETLHAASTRAGFSAFGPLTAWDFGPLSVKEVVLRDADGLAIALIERSSPPLTGFDAVAGPASYVFNSTQVVPDFEAARAFYVDVLGWKPFQETFWVHEDGRNCMGLPLDVARTRQLKVGIYHPTGSNEGSVEILQYAGEVLDFSRAGPADRGWASLRFPMREISGFLRRAEEGGCAIAQPRGARIEPYGAVEAGAAITPWGVRLEVFRELA